MPRLNRRQAQQAIADLRPFQITTGNLRGMTEYDGTGWLPAKYNTMEMVLSPYKVYSYGTPIAWIDRQGRWAVPRVVYSVTTSRHQGLVPQDGTLATAFLHTIGR